MTNHDENLVTEISSKAIDNAIDFLIQTMKDYGKTAIASSTPDYELTVQLKEKTPEEML
jgi:hypothetical protein